MTIHNKHSEILDVIIDLLYPLIILFGIYIVFKGSDSPGGGFQGGAILAAIFMARYLVDTESTINIETLKSLEKIFFILLLLLASFAIIYNMADMGIISKQLYLVVMNIFISIKVCCGISIIFFNFALIESR